MSTAGEKKGALGKKTFKPEVFELAKLAALIDPEGCKGDRAKVALENALGFLHAAELVWRGFSALTSEDQTVEAYIWLSKLGFGAVLDYSVARCGNLVGYRWDGEQELDPKKFVMVGNPPDIISA